MSRDAALVECEEQRSSCQRYGLHSAWREDSNAAEKTFRLPVLGGHDPERYVTCDELGAVGRMSEYPVHLREQKRKLARQFDHERHTLIPMGLNPELTALE